MANEDTRSELVVQCMWCGRIKDPAEGWKGDEGPLLCNASHGLCPPCALQHYGYHMRGSVQHTPDGPAEAPGRNPVDAVRHLPVNAGQSGA